MLIVDVDGTLVNTRAIRQRMAIGERLSVALETLDPEPITATVRLSQDAYSAGKEVVVLTARTIDDTEPTKQMLNTLGVPYHHLLLQPTPKRLDVIWKREAAKKLLQHHEPDKVLAVDDSPYIVDMWHQMNVPVIQVPGWDFEYEGPLDPELPEEAQCTIHQFLTT